MVLLYIQNLTMLLSFGALSYLIFSSPLLDNRKIVRQVLIGAILGTLTLLFDLNVFQLSETLPTSEFKTGPLLFAGYAGGPVGAVAAVSVFILLHIWLGEVMSVSAIIEYSTLAIIGGLVRLWMRPRAPQFISLKAAAILLIGFVVVHSIQSVVATPFAKYKLGLDAVATLGAGILSIFFTGLILGIAYRFAFQFKSFRGNSIRLDSFLHHSRMGMFESVPSNGFIWCDAGLSSMFSNSDNPQTIEDHKILTLIHDDDQSRLLGEWGNFLRSGDQHGRVETRIKSLEGKEMNVLINWVSERDRNNRVTRVIGLCTDLTTVRQAEQKHREIIQRFDLALSGSGIGTFDYRKGSDEVLYDEGMINIYGLKYKPGLVPVADWLRQIHPDDRENMQAVITKAWSEEHTSDKVDFRVIRSDGSVRYLRATWLHQPGTSSEAARFIGVATDLTDIRETERQKLEATERLALISDNLPGAVLQREFVDGKLGDIIHISSNAEMIWGYHADEIIADPSLFARGENPIDLSAFIKEMEVAVENCEPLTYRYQITHSNGDNRWVEYHGSPPRFRRDGRQVVEAIYLDVTREVESQARAEKERAIAYLAQKNESIGHLTAGVAHDFNNLLAVILGNLELLQEDTEDLDQNKLIAAAINATLRGADLTKNMLAFARQARLEPEVLDINQVVLESKNWIGRMLPESVSVETSLLAGLWKVEVDHSSLASAFLNLILNGRDAMGGRGKLTIETANVRIDDTYIDERDEELLPGRYVMLAISDTGTGIAEEDLEAIFEPFFTRKQPGSGTGLGLSMVLGFMKQSGGTVQLYTEINKGTTFKLYFPVSATRKIQADSPMVTPKDDIATGHKVLLVEDEEEVRNTLVSILERAGYHVTQAASGDKALEVFKSNSNFDLLLTDIVMPGTLQGTSLSRVLRDLRADLPVVFMSGYAKEATVHGNGLRPEDIRLMKPVQRTDLLAAVSKAISSSTT